MFYENKGWLRIIDREPGGASNSAMGLRATFIEFFSLAILTDSLVAAGGLVDGYMTNNN